MASRDRRPQSPSTRIAVARKRSPAEVVPPPRLHRTPQNAIARCVCPAGSCMGGYRTPAQLWSIGLLWPASDTLHQPGRLPHWTLCLEADVRRPGRPTVQSPLTPFPRSWRSPESRRSLGGADDLAPAQTERKNGWKAAYPVAGAHPGQADTMCAETVITWRTLTQPAVPIWRQ